MTTYEFSSSSSFADLSSSKRIFFSFFYIIFSAEMVEMSCLSEPTLICVRMSMYAR